MSRFKKSLVLVLLILGAIAWWQMSASPKAPADGPTQIVNTSAPVSSIAQSSQIKLNATQTSRAPASSEDTKQNLVTMINDLSKFSKPEMGINDLVGYLESSQQKPVVTRDVNPYSGEMHIVRTRKPLAGTRYFHAQFFTNDQGQAFAQHMSVEFQASPTAMAEVVAAVRQSFNLPAPKPQTEAYARWKISDAHILWVKRMTEEDLRDDPYNAYTSDDVGTIRVAIEAEIH